MRRWMQASSIVALAGLFLAGVVFGGEESAKPPAGKEGASGGCAHGKEAKASRHDYKPELRRITELKGMKVIGENGETLGTVEDTVIDVDHGRVAYAVVSHGGVAGIGDKDVLLPFVTIHCKSEGAQVRTKATADQIKQAEGFDEDDPEQVKKLSDPAFAERFHRQFDVRPYWERKGHSSEMKHERMGSGEKGSTESPQASAKEPAPREGSGSEPGTAGKRAGDIARKRGPGEMILASTLHHAGGVDIKTDAGVDVGNLNNLMVDLTRGHIAYAIVNRERELVSENQLCAVPWGLLRLRQTPPRPNLIVDLTVPKIKDAPGFPAGHWPDMTKADWNEQINAYFDSTPYYVIYGYVTPAEGQGPAHTIEGTIVSIDRDARGPGLDQPGVQVTLKVESDETWFGRTLEGRMVVVSLAPARFLADKGIILKEGGRLEITGVAVHHPDMPDQPDMIGQTVIVAQQVRMGDQSASLRSDRGEPMWSADD